MTSHENELLSMPALGLYELMNAKLEAAPVEATDEKAYLEELAALEKNASEAKKEQKAIRDERLKISSELAEEKSRLMSEFSEYKHANSKKFLRKDSEKTVKAKEQAMRDKIEALSCEAGKKLQKLAVKLETADKKVSREVNKVKVLKEEQELLAREKGQSAVLKKFEEMKISGFTAQLESQGEHKEKVKFVLNPDGYTAKVIKKTEEPAWTKSEEATLTLIADLVSGDDVYDEKGEEVKKEDRIRTVLLRNTAALCELAKARKEELEHNRKQSGPFGGLRKKANQEQIKVLEAVKDGVLNSLLDKLNELSRNAVLTADKVKNILQSEAVDKYLAESDKKYTMAVRDSEKLVEDMLEIATEDLLRGTDDDAVNEAFAHPLLQEFKPVVDQETKLEYYSEKETEENKNKIEESDEAKKEREEREAQKAKLEADKEKLRKLREAVYDTEKGQGRFLRDVMRGYYKAATPEEKRFMMSYIIRDMKPMQKTLSARQKGAGYFASMLKGAGPLMQKLFQGIPEQMLMKEFHGALKVVKSDLRSLPKEYVDAKLNKIAASSKGKILSITKKQSLGAASIAETFLCDVVYKDGTKEEVVVKLLRPDALKRLRNEKKFIEKCADETDENGVMMASFKAHLLKIEEEFDLKNEAKNVHSGRRYNITDAETGGIVKSVVTNKNIPAGKDYLVMNKAEGQTLDRYLDELNKYTDGCLNKFMSYNDKTKSDYNATPENIDRLLETTGDIERILAQAELFQKHMDKLAWLWIEKALFENFVSGSNFHHGDLHAGNIMIDDKGATVLDYGNATKLPVAKVKIIVKMMAAVLAGFTDDFVNSLGELISLDKTNSYNKLSDEEKLGMKNDLKAKLEEVFKLGTPQQTGEKIFVSLLKAQEAGFHLPQEIQNFSQCEQRLENSMAEINAAVEKLRAVYKRAVCMPEYIGSDSLMDPMLILHSKNHSNPTDIQKNTQDVMREFGIFDEKRFEAEFRDEKNRESFANKYLSDISNAVKTLADEEGMSDKERAQSIESYRVKYKRFMEMRKSLKDMGFAANEIIKVEDKNFRAEYYALAAIEVDIRQMIITLSSSGIDRMLGGSEHIQQLVTLAFDDERQESFDEAMDLIGGKLDRLLALDAKFRKIETEGKKGKKAAEDDFLSSYKQVQDELSMAHSEYIYMQRSVLTPELFDRDFMKEDQQKVSEILPEKKQLIESKKAQFERQSKRYFKDRTRLGAEFRYTYDEFRKTQAEYLDKCSEGVKDAGALRTKLKTEVMKFLAAYRKMVAKDFEKVNEMNSRDHEYELNDFLDIMADRMLDNKKKVGVIFNTDLGRYKKALGEVFE